MTRLLLLIALLLPACTAGHVRAFESAQAAFNTLAAQESAAAPAADLFDLPRHAALHEKYAQLVADLDALLRTASPALERDALLPAAQTLRVLALWRAAFHADISGQPGGLPDPLVESAAIPAASLSARDAFLLRALPHRVAYDRALVAYAALMRNPGLAAPAKVNALPAILNPLAESAVAVASLPVGGDLAACQLITAHRMLATAHAIAIGPDASQPAVCVVSAGVAKSDALFAALAPYRAAVAAWNARVSASTLPVTLKLPAAGRIPEIGHP